MEKLLNAYYESLRSKMRVNIHLVIKGIYVR